MRIRRLSFEEGQQFRQLRLEGLKHHPEAFGASYEDELAQPLEQTAASLVNCAVFGGFDPTGALRGIVGLRKENSPKFSHIATLWGMYVSPVSRGTGMAQGLLQAAVSEAADNCQSVRLSVVTSNAAAIRLYEKAGFRIWAVDTKALFVGGLFLDEALMRLDFG